MRHFYTARLNKTRVCRLPLSGLKKIPVLAKK